MSKQKILFIINPNSGGKSKNKNIEEKIKKIIPENASELIFEYTARAGHAAEIVSEYLQKGLDHFVAVGGDGTVNEIATRLRNTGALLSIIPLGSGNGLARHLNISFKLEKAVKIILDKNIKTIDSGEINGIPFFCTAGIGFDAYCADIFNNGHHGRGLSNYVRIILTNFFTYKAKKCSFEGNPVEYFSMSFGNADQFGNNAYITPKAIIDDDFLDCTLIKKHPKFHGLELMYRLMNKTIDQSRYTEYYRAKTFKVEADENLLIHFDGESKQLDTHRLEVKIIEKALRITSGI